MSPTAENRRRSRSSVLPGRFGDGRRTSRQGAGRMVGRGGAHMVGRGAGRTTRRAMGGEVRPGYGYARSSISDHGGAGGARPSSGAGRSCELRESRLRGQAAPGHGHVGASHRRTGGEPQVTVIYTLIHRQAWGEIRKKIPIAPKQKPLSLLPADRAVPRKEARTSR